VTVLQIAALATVALGGTGVVITGDPLSQTLVLSIYGLALTVLFFVFAATVLGAVLVVGFARLPDFGHYHGVYGNVLNGVGVSLRHATDLVTALNFDFRGFDTLGEEFILFASVLGIALILRELRDEHQGPKLEEAEAHHLMGASEALRTMVLLGVPFMLALGVYIVVHGQITPGGGFQGGIVLASGPLALFLAGRYLRTRFLSPHTLLEIGEVLGAAGYGMVGLAGLVGVEVSGAFLVAWSELLDQALMVRRRRGQ
jgi:multicomponent Na+:H+ antiporter subunit B